MKTKNQIRLSSARTFQTWLLASRTGRVTGLLILAMATAAIAVTTLSFAQSEKKVVLSEPAQKPVSSLAVPTKSSPARTASTKLKRGSRRNGQQEQDRSLRGSQDETRDRTRGDGRPREGRLRRARPFTGDLRQLPQDAPDKVERPEREEPEVNPSIFVPPNEIPAAKGQEIVNPDAPLAGINAPAPPPSRSFDGLNFGANGNGHPPDTNGDVGPNHYIQTINTSIGIYDKTTGSEITHFSFNTFMSQGHFGNLCDTNNFGDPVVLYDTFEDRWVITDFAFSLDGLGNVINPPGSFQCFAVSQSGDPVAGGWNYYSINTTGGLGDYPKFGIWPDGLYMSTNMFGYGAGAPFQNVRVYALNKAQMYAGAPSVQSVSFDAPSAEFSLLPSNARLQTGTPPPGSPNYYSVVWQFLNVVSVYKFHVDWNSVSTSSFTGPFMSLTPIWWAQFSGANGRVPSPANNLDTLYPRLMMQNQYTNIGGVESLWDSHTVGAGNPTSNVSSAQAAVRYYQVKITGGNVEANATQSFTFSPDATIHRFMPSTAVDRLGDMAIGYSASNATLNPALRYAGRLSTDPPNSITQTETSLFEGTGSQLGNCGSSACTRWGDYSAMTLDPDGCTFWYTNEYYVTNGLNHHTRIGAFSFPQCTTIGSGSIQGSVTSSSGGGPIPGATVALGSRTTTTDSSGFYSFPNLPAGTYPSINASFPGYSSATVNSLVVNQGSVTTQNFVLSPGANSGCFTDTTQADFQTGVLTSVDVTTSPGDVILTNPSPVDQKNESITNSGFGFNNTAWVGQTFTAAVTGKLVQADLYVFCSGCSGVNPNITVSLRASSASGTTGLPTGADLASATMPGFNDGAAGGYHSVTFTTPPTLTAGTQYALVMRANAARTGVYAYVVSSGNPYTPRGRRVTSATSGSTWVFPAGAANSLGFRTYMNTGFALSGNLVSGVKDANPHTGGAVTWTTLSWNASTPAGTTVKFQVAGSNSANGPFNFVGPDGTPATFFTTSGASLAQFNGLRYLKYTAFLSTTSGAATPTLNDVTVCFDNTVPTTLTVGSATGTYGGTVNLSATLTDGVSPLSGKTVNFTLNGNSVGSGVTDGSGVATLTNASLAGINANTYPNGVGASVAGDVTYLASSATNSLTVNKADAVITVTGYSVTYDGNPHTATGTATGVNNESLAGLNLSGTTHTNAGTYNGDPWTFTDVTGNYNDASGTVNDSIGKANASITVNGYTGVYDGNAHGATGSATGVNAENLSSLLNLGASFTNVPGGTAHWTFNAANTNGNYNSASGDVAIIITKATPVFSNLSSPTIGCGATPTTLGGKIKLGALVPTGSVAITFNSTTQNAPIQPDGSFSASFATGSLTPADSPKSIAYNYGGDGNFNPISGGGTLIIVDGAPPTITLNGNVISLWPPNKKFHTINVTDLVASAGDGCDPSVNINNVVIAKVTSDEGTSSGGDIVIAGNCKSVQLRADRDGNGDGRVYTITFLVRDVWGNTTTRTAQVTVPHDQGNGNNAVDSGVAYTINGTCP